MRTVELVSEWDSVPFDGGYAGLRTLSDQGFSGAVVAGPTQLFMLNGTVVGILDGDIEAFEDADGTARAAPHDALPLLTVMQDRADEPRAQYYTEDTSIAEVDRTLKDGNFTGYVELSENVLSGDYYLVYHQGRSMSVAWVGSAERLVTDDEAFEEANDEVGIYRVMPAAIEPVDLPEPPEPSPQGGEAATATEDAGDVAGSGADQTEPQPADDGAGTPTATESAETADGTGGEPTDAGASGTAETDPSAGPPGSKAAGASQGTAVDRQTEREETDRRQRTDSGETQEPTGTTTTGTESPEAATEAADTTAEQRTETADVEPEPAEQRTETENVEPEPAESVEATPATTETADAATSEEPTQTDTAQHRTQAADQTASGAPKETDSDAVGALETRSIPSLDPERSTSAAESTATQQSPPSAKSTAAPTESRSTDTEPDSPASTTPESQSTDTEPDSPASTTSDDAGRTDPSQLRAELSDREERIAELEQELSELSTENEELAAERDRLVAELEEARAEIQQLEDDRGAASGPTAGGRQLSATEAIDGTNLFVRYHSKGEATLAKAQDGSADRASVEENLRLEYHTQFDSDEATVDGAGFEQFLKESIHYRFVDWLIRGLLYEIRDTGHESAMGVLYDALPEIDRAELNGSVSVTYTEDGQEHRSQERFDVVVRDRMGNPLVVANINDAREPATEGQMTDIIRNAERVGNVSDSLAATFLVTSSFFEPEALETAREATSSGLFSRDKRKSFVNLSRKGGYHLCLLEARNREFHLAVPEL